MIRSADGSSADRPVHRPLRIAHVVSSLEIGGQEKVVLDLSRSLRRRGHAVSVVSLAEGGGLRAEFGNIPVLVTARKAGPDVNLFNRLRQAFADMSVDVVHTHNPAALTYAAPAAKLAGVRRIVHTKHGANPVPHWRALLVRRAVARLCHAFVAVSEETARIARRTDAVDAPRLQVVPNGIDVDAFARDENARATQRRALGIPPSACVIGTVGRLAREKNQTVLLRAALPLIGPSIRVAIVGDGPLRAQLEAVVPRDKAAFVHFLGARRDVSAMLSAFDIFALTSDTEGLPLVVPEAMASGLPVVSTNVGGLARVVDDDVFGRLVPPRDVGALRVALAELIANPNMRKSWGERALAAARARYSLDRVVDAYEGLYQGGHRP